MATDETGQDPKLPPDVRLESLEQRLERLQQAEADRTHKAVPNPTTRIWQLMFSHLIGAPAGGGIIGWGLDSLFGTLPTLFLIMRLTRLGESRGDFLVRGHVDLAEDSTDLGCNFLALLDVAIKHGDLGAAPSQFARGRLAEA